MSECPNRPFHLLFMDGHVSQTLNMCSCTDVFRCEADVFGGKISVLLSPAGVGRRNTESTSGRVGGECCGAGTKAEEEE